jgi:hypothetical protein
VIEREATMTEEIGKLKNELERANNNKPQQDKYATNNKKNLFSIFKRMDPFTLPDLAFLASSPRLEVLSNNRKTMDLRSRRQMYRNKQHHLLSPSHRSKHRNLTSDQNIPSETRRKNHNRSHSVGTLTTTAMATMVLLSNSNRQQRFVINVNNTEIVTSGNANTVASLLMYYIE